MSEIYGRNFFSWVFPNARFTYSSISKGKGEVNADCQVISGVTKSTASRDLNALVWSGVILKKGTTGKGTYYHVADLYE